MFSIVFEINTFVNILCITFKIVSYELSVTILLLNLVSAYWGCGLIVL